MIWLRSFLISLFILFHSIIAIPFISNAIFISKVLTNSTTLENVTCNQCLCLTVSLYPILNCFPNNSCQFFPVTPVRYSVKPMSGARLYFPLGTIPNKSECLISNVTEVIQKLQNSNQTRVNVTSPRGIKLDDRGMLFTVSFGRNAFVGYNSTNLNEIVQLMINTSRPYSLSYFDGVYYIGLQNDSILLVNNLTFRILNIISSPYLLGVRDMIFLHDGEIMVVSATSNGSLVFFRRTNRSQPGYTFFFNQKVNFLQPHGMFYVHDALFYVTSWQHSSIYAMTPLDDTTWKETLVATGQPWVSTSCGRHLMIDECDRYWLAACTAGFMIFDHQGTYLTSYRPTLNVTNGIFDGIIDDSYNLYMADTTINQIIRIHVT